MKRYTCIPLAALAIWMTAALGDDTLPPSSIVATGVVLPNRSVVLAAKILGRIDSIRHEESESVKQGDTLLTLDSTELDAELASARASLALAKTELDYRNTLAERMQRLAKSRSVSKDMVDDAVFGYASARDRIKIAEATIAKVQAMLRETRIIAPFDGVITRKQAEIGQLTRPGEPLIDLADHSRLKFKTRIKEQELPYIEVGSPVAITIDALDELQLEGTVSKIIPSGDPVTHTFPVEITLPEQRGLYPGMFGKADFGS